MKIIKKTIKLNFSKIENVLSRDEMKNIMAGSGSCEVAVDQCGNTCIKWTPDGKGGATGTCSTCCLA